MVWKELDKPRQTFICLRGDFLRPDKEVGPLVPDVLDAVPPKLPPAEIAQRASTWPAGSSVPKTR